MRKKEEIPHPHDLLFAEVFSRKEVMAGFLKYFAGKHLPAQSLRLETLRLEPASYVKPQLKRLYSDLVFSCLYGKQPVEICIINEHKSNRPKAPHFQLLGYIDEKWRQDVKLKKKRTPVVCILLYHGKQKWRYKSMSAYIKGMDDALARFNPLFDFILIDLDEFSDEFILAIDTIFLVNTLLMLKHSGDTNYVQQNIGKIFVHAERYIETDEGKKFIETMFVYLTRTTELSAKEIRDASIKSSKLKEMLMKGYTLLELELEEREVKGMEKGMEKGMVQKEFILIKRGWEKGLTPEFIAEFGDIPLKKVKEMIAKLEAEKKKPGKNGQNEKTVAGK